MTDIISTGIAIDSSAAVKAKQDMEALAGAGGKVDSALAKVDQSSVKTGKSLATLGNYAKQIASSNRDAVNELERLNTAQGRQEVLLKQLGSGFVSLAREIKEATAALQGSGKGFKTYEEGLDKANAKQKAVGVSAAQTAAALRGVPAQFTDILTSLQGGQAPLTVFLQQGGQLKDMFGGAGAAARALGGYIAGLITPFTVAAAAGAAFAVAAYQGSQEVVAYNKALTLTGNVAGKTASDLQAMAASIAETNGTQGQAAAALAASVESGKIASGALEAVGSAAVSMSRVLGVSIDEAVASFVKLADEPAKASAKLNEQYHYLDLATYERIRALEEQGKKEEAAALAQTTYANATNERLRQVEAQAGVLSRAWQMLGKDAREAWDLMQGIGRPKTTADLLSDAQQRVRDTANPNFAPKAGLWDSLRLAMGGGASVQAEAQADVASLSRKFLRDQEAAYAQGESARTEQAKIGASERLKVLENEVRTNADKRKKAIADLNNDFKILGKATSGAEYDKLVADINDKYKDPKGAKGAKPKAFQDDAGTKYLETLRQQGAVLQEQLSSTGKLTDAEREQAKFTQLVADLKGKDQLTAEQKSLLAAREKIAAQLQINVLTEREVGFQKILADDAKRRADAEKATARAVTGNGVRIADSLDRQREQYDDRLGVVGLGSQAAEELKSRQQVEREYSRMQAQLTKTAAENATLEGEAYKQGTRDIAAAREQALGINEAYYTRLREMQGDSSLGAAQALANYRDESANVYKQVEQLTGNAFKGMEDALVTFATTGKLSFKSLADSIVADLIRMQARAAITSAIGGSNGWLSTLLGGGSTAIAGSTLSNSFIKSVGMSASGIVPMAKGGVFDSPSLNAYSGRVYDKPQLFAFAKGAGVFGEAGPEAIMPLRRGRDGKLGVAASSEGSGGQGMVFAPVTNIQIDARTDQGAVYEIANRAVADAQESYTEELRRMRVLPQ